MTVPTVEDLRIALEAGDANSAEQLLAGHPELANSREKTPPPLHLMVWCNRPEMVELLLDHGADIESRDQDNDTTPVRYAIVYGRREMIRLLVARGANLGVLEGKDSSALDVALQGADGGFEEFEELPSRQEYREVAELLRELGAE